MNRDREPLVSVIMPAYNAEKYIKQAIYSVLTQTYTNLELIVIDDCSKDNTYKIVQEIAKEDNRILVYKNDKNSGVAYTRNTGLNVAQGEYVALLDSDDIWKEQKIEEQIKLAKNKKADIVYCSYEIVDESGNKKTDFIVEEKTDFSAMLIKNMIGCSTAVITKEIARKYKFDETYYHEDYIFWLNLLSNGYKAVGVKESLVEYRMVDNSRSSNKVRSAVKRWKIYRQYLKIPLIKTIYIWFLYSMEAIKKYYY